MSMLLLNLCEKMIMTYVVILKKKKQKKKILINIYTRVCAYVDRNFFFFIETKKMENCVFGLIKRSFFISSFLDY